MDIIIKNEKLTVRISPVGAEIQSIRDNEGTEFLWNGNPAYWTGRAPNLFPYIGRLTDKTYMLDRKMYQMGIHGFAAQMDFSIKEKTEHSVSFLLKDNALTRKIYPRCFTLTVTYRLSGMHLSIIYSVENTGKGAMYFGIGGHPGFLLPFERDLKFEDYYLEFGEARTPVRIGFSDTCFRTNEDKPYPLENGCELPLSHNLFDNDAIVLENISRSVALKSRLGEKAVRVTYPDMQYLGIWHMPKTDAPYLCIEPWTSLPSHQGIIEDLAKQKDLISLSAGAAYVNEWTIEILNKNTKQ